MSSGIAITGKAALVSLTDFGFETCLRIGRILPGNVSKEYFVSSKVHQRYFSDEQSEKTAGKVLKPFSYLREIVPELWQDFSLLIFVMAAGIVVRQIAPFIKCKDRDPAVLVLDEQGKFVIPLLSGHLGGANAWSRLIGSQLEAVPVITTATDVRGMVAPDEYARRYGWKVEPINHLPAVNSKLLEARKLYVRAGIVLGSEYEALRKDPHYHFLLPEDRAQADVFIDVFLRPEIRRNSVYLVPPLLSVGVGCRKGTAGKVILEQIQKAVNQLGASMKGISGIYSIDIKANEAGLIEAADCLRVPFRTFRGDELQAVNLKEQLSPSDFVREKIGVDGVCEAASLLGAKGGRLIVPKTKGQGVTVAISMESSLSSALVPETNTI